MPLKLVLGVRGTELGPLKEGGGGAYLPPFQCIPAPGPKTSSRGFPIVLHWCGLGWGGGGGGMVPGGWTKWLEGCGGHTVVVEATETPEIQKNAQRCWDSAPPPPRGGGGGNA